MATGFTPAKKRNRNSLSCKIKKKEKKLKHSRAQTVGLGVRVYPKFRVGFFGFFKYRVSNSGTRTVLVPEISGTRNFGYRKFGFGFG
jgi:hypothetical protein